ncbi:MAG: carboxymuconolactone decarboxylase family protein [Acidobacteriota bacterium]
MAWIKLIEPDEAEGKLKNIYEAFAKANRGGVGPMMRAGSLNADALEGRSMMYRALMFGRASSLTRSERELIAVVTSAVNGCHF